MKKSKRTLTPKLRFPEFRDKPGWDVSTVGELVATVSPPKKLTTSQYFPEGRFPIVDQSPDAQCGWTNDLDALIESSLPLIVFGDHTCVLKLVNQPFAQGADGIKIFRPKRSVRTEYLYHFLCARPLVMENYKRHFSILKGMQVFYPEDEGAEQQKIAECLSSLDGLIAAEDRKLDALKAHKKGLMQQLFPQPGQIQPILRFPEFQDKGAWEEKAISKLGEVITGSTPSTAQSEYYGGDRQFVSPADISESRFITETKTTLTELGFQQTRPIKAKSVLFVCIGSTIGKVAQNLTECATNQQINSVIAGPGTSADFLYYLLSECSKRIAEIAGSQAVPIINKSLFSGFKVRCPKEDEQQKIADCLSVLDTQIAAQAAKINAHKLHKRGLMQQLFPAPEEP